MSDGVLNPPEVVDAKSFGVVFEWLYTDYETIGFTKYTHSSSHACFHITLAGTNRLINPEAQIITKKGGAAYLVYTVSGLEQRDGIPYISKNTVNIAQLKAPILQDIPQARKRVYKKKIGGLRVDEYRPGELSVIDSHPELKDSAIGFGTYINSKLPPSDDLVSKAIWDGLAEEFRPKKGEYGRIISHDDTSVTYAYEVPVSIGDVQYYKTTVLKSTVEKGFQKRATVTVPIAQPSLDNTRFDQINWDKTSAAPRKCGVCGEIGHNKRSCPKKESVDDQESTAVTKAKMQKTSKHSTGVTSFADALQKLELAKSYMAHDVFKSTLKALYEQHDIPVLWE